MDAFIGEIRPFAFGYQPSGWIQCNGQILDLRQFQALYSLLGNTFGGNLQQNTFGIPNLQGVAIMGSGTGVNSNATTCTPPTPATAAIMGPGAGTNAQLTPRTYATYYGGETVTLTTQQMPVHSHAINVATPTQAQATTMTGTPSTATIPARELTALLAYNNVATGTAGMSPASLSGIGSGTSHENRQPYLAFNYCICWEGVYPDFP